MSLYPAELDSRGRSRSELPASTDSIGVRDRAEDARDSIPITSFPALQTWFGGCFRKHYPNNRPAVKSILKKSCNLSPECGNPRQFCVARHRFSTAWFSSAHKKGRSIQNNAAALVMLSRED